MNSLVFEGEYLEDLQRNGLRIIQPEAGYRFNVDSVILAHFAASFSLTGTVVDLGTGSGVILLLISALCPGLRLVGIEIQEDAADRARRSVKLNCLSSAIDIIKGDLRNILSYFDAGSVDAVVSNPPFFPKGAGPVNRNMEIALAKQELECTLDDVFASAGRILKNKGRFFLVHRPDRLAEICFIGRKNELEPKTLRIVSPRVDSEPSMVLVECIKHGAPGLRIIKPLTLMDDSGQPSPEIKAMYGVEE